MTTLSVVDLTKAGPAAMAISRLADEMRKSLAAERDNIRTARSKMTTYGAGDGLRTSVDLPSFLALYLAQTSNPAIKTASKAALDATLQVVVTNYASAVSAQTTGSEGIAIYFPEDRADFDRTRISKAILRIIPIIRLNSSGASFGRTLCRTIFNNSGKVPNGQNSTLFEYDALSDPSYPKYSTPFSDLCDKTDRQKGRSAGFPGRNLYLRGLKSTSSL